MGILKLRDFKDQGYNVTKCIITSRSEADTYKWLMQKCIWEDNKKGII